MKSFYKKTVLFLLVSMLGIVSFYSIYVYSPRLLSPISDHVDVFDEVLPKLEMYRNSYTLSEQHPLIAKSYASSSFDDAKAYALIDYDSGSIIQDKNLDQRLPIASLTKIMTAIVSLDLLSPNELLSVSKHATTIEPTVAGFTFGERLTTEELLHALLLTSANDAAQVLKEGVDKKYGGKVFLRAMNAKAQYLGLQGSHFENPQGFDDPGHESTVRDLAILTHYALTTYPLLAQIVKKDHEILPANVNHRQFDLNNWNGLLDVYPGVTGVKIGNTDLAQKTTIVLSSREEKTLLVVVLGAPTLYTRDRWAADLLDSGFQQTLGLEPIAVTDIELQKKYNTWKYWN